MPKELYIALALALGAFLGWLISRLKGSKLSTQNQNLVQQVASAEEQLKELKTEVQDLQERLRLEGKQLASVETLNGELQRKVTELESRSEKENQQLLLQFERLGQKILEENSQKITHLNKDQLGQLLDPLRERLMLFQKRVEESHLAGEKRTSALSQQLKSLQELNQQITEEAKNLSQALRGDSKLQGNWGEMQLEKILQKSGLEKGTHYRKEESFKNETGQQQRLDYIIDLPDGKHLIIDSKVSLTAYANYYQATEPKDQERYKKQHLQSVYAHMKTLSAKNYQELYAINTPDYVMLFVANEPALNLALREDPELYEKALQQNLVLVSASTLMATMRTVSYIWRQEAQNQNAQLIARQAGALYDKFVGFTEDMQKLGNQMNTATKTYHEAMKKLSEGSGNLIRRSEKLRELGAETSKKLSDGLRSKTDD